MGPTLGGSYFTTSLAPYTRFRNVPEWRQKSHPSSVPESQA